MSELRADQIDGTAPAALPVRIPHFTTSFVIAVLDVAAIALACVLSDAFYHLAVYGDVLDSSVAPTVGATVGLIFVMLSRSLGLYDLDRLMTGISLGRVMQAWLFSLLTFEAMLVLLKYNPDYSRGALIGFALAAPLLLNFTRNAAAQKLRTWQSNGVVCALRGIVIGTPQELARFSADDLLQRYGTLELKRYQLTSVSPEFIEADRRAIRDVIDLAREANADKIWLALPWSDAERRRMIVRELDCLPLDIALLPDAVAQDLLHPTELTPSKRLTIDLSRAPLSLFERFTKRSLDIAVSLAGITLLLPLFIAIAIAVKLSSPGKVLFRQDRVGFNGRTFGIYKFRSMTVTENGNTIRQANKNDSRVTPIGRILRSSSLDELPQLFNVLRGEMSLVGPRPHALAHDGEYGSAIAKYAFRHHVKPGITGWAQVHGLRGPTPKLEMMAQRIEYDLWYIANWSIWLDLKILAKTVIEVFRSRNAF